MRAKQAALLFLRDLFVQLRESFGAAPITNCRSTVLYSSRSVVLRANASSSRSRL